MNSFCIASMPYFLLNLRRTVWNGRGLPSLIAITSPSRMTSWGVALFRVSTTSGRASVTSSSFREYILLFFPCLWNWNLLPSYLYSAATVPFSAIAWAMDPCWASIIFTGWKGMMCTSARKSLPFLARSATSPRSLRAWYARSTREGSTEKARAIASRIIPSPIPIRRSSRMSRARYFASRGDAFWKRLRIRESFSACEARPPSREILSRSE